MPSLTDQIKELKVRIIRLENRIEETRNLFRKPSRYLLPWTESERKLLGKEFKKFVKSRAELHERTEAAILSRIHDENWLRWTQLDADIED